MEVVYIADVQKTYAVIIGAVLVLLGIVGFVPNPLVGDASSAVFGVNMYQNVLHLVGGALILWLSMKSPKSTNMVVGVVALVVGILWFAESLDGGLLAKIFGINAAISYLHIAVGVVSLGVYYGVKE